VGIALLAAVWAVHPPDKPIPPQPQLLSVTPNSIAVTWAPPLSSGDAINQYELQVRKATEKTWKSVSAALTGMVGSYHDWTSKVWGEIREDTRTATWGGVGGYGGIGQNNTENVMYPHQSIDYTYNTGHQENGASDYQYGNTEYNAPYDNSGITNMLPGGSDYEWTAYSSTLGQISQGHLEEQTVTTRADSGEMISDGWFRLSFNSNGYNDFDSETDTLTRRIPYDASAAEMQSALQELLTVATVQVAGRVAGQRLVLRVCPSTPKALACAIRRPELALLAVLMHRAATPGSSHSTRSQG